MTEKAMPPSRRPATPSTFGWGVHGAGHPEQVLLGATQFSNQPQAHFGDLFPLPLPTDFGYPGRIEDLGLRRSQQRVAKRRSLASVHGLARVAPEAGSASQVQHELDAQGEMPS